MTRPSRLAASLLLAGTMLAGCTSHNGYVGSLPQDPAVMTIHHFNAAMQCARPFIERALARRGDRILFLVGDLGDLTQNPRDPYTGPLSHGGHTVMTSLLRSHSSSRHVRLPLNQPKEVRYFFAGEPFSARQIQSLRQRYRANRIIAITGGFTSFDQVRTRNSRGLSLSARQDSYDARAELGNSNEGGRINLVLNIGDAATNSLLGTIRLTGSVRKRSTSFRGTVEINGFGGGLSANAVEIDGIHSVQENLIAAAHFHMWGALLSTEGHRDCLHAGQSSPAALAERMRAFEDAPRPERHMMLQAALNRFLQGVIRPLEVDGQLGAETLKAIGIAERQLRLLPHVPGEYGTLYLHLISQPAEAPA